MADLGQTRRRGVRYAGLPLPLQPELVPQTDDPNVNGSDVEISLLDTARAETHPSLKWLERIRPEPWLIRGRTYQRVKRALDIVLTMVSAPLLIPLLATCWAAVKAESPRAPALFVQSRTGRGGRRFRMYKFRTMVPDAEALKPALSAVNQRRWPDFKIEQDPRITRLGRVLRKASLDEIPQFLNVLKGDMSLVGPRPTSFGPETYAEWQKERLTVPPGLTGLWQIQGRGEMEFDERVRIDLAYVERRCLALDLLILLRTVPVVFTQRGSH